MWVPPSTIVVCGDDSLAVADRLSPHIRQNLTADHESPPCGEVVAAAHHSKSIAKDETDN
jgi:hypothetical protein